MMLIFQMSICCWQQHIIFLWLLLLSAMPCNFSMYCSLSENNMPHQNSYHRPDSYRDLSTSNQTISFAGYESIHRSLLQMKFFQDYLLYHCTTAHVARDQEQYS